MALIVMRGCCSVPPSLAGSTTLFSSRVKRARSVPACADSSSERIKSTVPSRAPVSSA